MKQKIDVDYILERTDLVQLAERAGARLKKSGGGSRGACPLHGGDNPSAFHIYTGKDGRQRWHCHTGCNDGGDAIDFVRQLHHLSDDAEGFLEAVRLLAETAGISLVDAGLNAEQARQATERRRARRDQQNLLALAARYYTGLLHSPAGKQGMAYARDRGWTEETIKHLRLGYSDGQLLAHLREQDAGFDLALKAGLITQRDDGSLADTIPAGYLVYPHIHRKRYIYLSGRAIHTDDPARKARNLKAPRRLYWALHNHDTPLLVVEGQACAITAWQWGYNTVALCGTHLDEETSRSIREYPAIYLALDPDAAGKIAGVADVLGPLAMIVTGVPEKDLNDWLTKAKGTKQKLAGLLKKAKPWIEVTIEQTRKAPVYELEGHLEHLAELVAQLAPAMRSRYVREICDRHHLSSTRDFRHLVDAYTQDTSAANGFEVIDGRMTHYGDPLCNLTIQISHELIQDDGMNSPSIVYTAVGTLDTKERLEPIEVKAEEFDSMRWIARHWGARPILYVPPGKIYLLRRAIQEVSQAELKRERVHTFTGWAEIEGRWLFLTTAGGLGTGGLDPDVRVDLGNNNLGRYALPAPPDDLRPAIQASLDFLQLAPYSVTLPLWAAMYAAPLSPIRTLNAILWVYGSTQSGKSTISHLALSHYGSTFIDGHDYRAPKDWTSTPTDLERAMFVVKDTPVVLDDYAPAHSGAAEARQMARKAHYVVRSVGNRSSRGRANADLSERQQRPPRGLVIATAENPLVGQSIVGRMIYVPVEAEQVIRANGEGETDLDTAQQQAMDGLYAQAMAGYVVWLARNWERLQAELPPTIERASRTGRQLFPSGQSRLTDYYGLLTTAAQLALEYAAEHGVVSRDDAKMLGEVYRHELIDLLRSQSERVATQSPVLKFFQALADMLAQEKVYFAPRKDNSFFPPERAERIGWYDEQYVYLLTNAALALVKGYWQTLDERFDTLADALRRELWQQGYVAKRDGKHFERKAYIDRKVGRQRVLVLGVKVLEEKSGISLTGKDEARH